MTADQDRQPGLLVKDPRNDGLITDGTRDELDVRAEDAGEQPLHSRAGEDDVLVTVGILSEMGYEFPDEVREAAWLPIQE
jgi:hypothetical protein